MQRQPCASVQSSALQVKECQDLIPPHRPSSPDLLNRAVALLRLRASDLKAAAQNRSARRDLEQLRRRLQTLEIENAHLRQTLSQRGAETSAAPSSPAPLTRAHQIVQEMTAYMHQHYRRPLGLRDVAAALKMNASYLSSLFSQTQGLAFHRYLENFRLTKAKELLRDPHRRVCEVACVVGYASPDQFRHVFKLRVGVAPSAWRLRHADPSLQSHLPTQQPAAAAENSR